MIGVVTMCAMAIAAVSPVCRADALDDFNLAMQLYKQERWERAEALLEGFLEQAPNHQKAPLAKLYLGQSRVHLREFAKARPVFRDFVRTQPQHAEIALAMYRVGECSYFLNDFPTARKELRDFLSNVPPDHKLAPWALQYLGETELRLGNMQAAADVLERLLNQFKDNPLAEEARFSLARAYDGLDRSADAVELYRAIAENPQGARATDAQFNLAGRLFKDEQYADAAAAFETVAQADPQHHLAAVAILNAGFSRYHLGEYGAATEAFRKVEADAKHGRTARYWIALSDKSQGHYKRAGDALSALYQEDEQQPLAQSLLFHTADSRLRAKTYADAILLFVKVADRFPTGELADDALYSAIEAALHTDDVEQAESLHARFTEQFPDSGLLLPSDLLYGRLLLARGDKLDADDDEANREQAQQTYQKAADVFTRVLQSSKLPNTQTHARLQLARAWSRLEEYERLVETLGPLAAGASAENATDEQLRALFMQSNGWLALEEYDRALETAQRYLEKRSEGGDAAEALANTVLALAHLGEWDSAEVAQERLRSMGDPALSGRITYELADLAYNAGRWETAQSLYHSVIKQGPEGEFYVPSVSGLAYSLHESGRASLKASADAREGGEPIDGTVQLAEAISRFNDAARWFDKLIELAARQQDIRVQSNAAYLRGLSLKLARRLPEATAVLVPAAKQFSLPQDLADPSPEQLEAALGAYRSWKEAARTFTELGETDQADEAYDAAIEELKRQPSERRGELDMVINEWALLHYNADDFDRSDELFRLLIDEAPQSQWADDARLILAESEFFADRFEPARDAFREIVGDGNTDDFVRKRALLLLIDSAHALSDWETLADAAGALNKILQQQTPESADRWYAEFRIGEAALRRGDPAAAATSLKAVIDQHAETEIGQTEWFPNVWLMLAESQLRLKDYAAVDENVARFKQQHADSPLTYQLDDVLGRRYKNEGRFDESRQAFQRVIDSRDGRATETAAKAQFLTAETFLTQANALKMEAPEKATKLYDAAFLAYFRVLQYDFPQWQAPALLMAGKCDEALKRWSGAKKSYRQLTADFADSKYAEQAHERLTDLERRFPATTTP